jgi:hypothetical protein
MFPFYNSHFFKKKIKIELTNRGNFRLTSVYRYIDIFFFESSQLFIKLVNKSNQYLNPKLVASLIIKTVSIPP